MADIVLSYCREDLRFAQEIAGLIEQTGLTVWWDRNLVPGNNYYAAIEAEIASARKVFVLWSKDSVTSGWVLSEAEEGREQQKLVPIVLDNCRIPFGFRHLHSIDIAGFRTRALEILAPLRGASEPLRTAVGKAREPMQRGLRATEDESARAGDCDRLAGDPDDTDHVGAGVDWNAIDAFAAIRACTAATAQSPDEARLAYQLGRAYHKSEQYKRAFKWYETAAGLGSAAAMASLGSMFENGKGVTQDYLAATHRYLEAFKLGRREVAVLIADLYANGGHGLRADHADALVWYRKAADQEMLEMHRFGEAFRDGYGYPIDEAFARSFLEVAADSGNAEAMDVLGELTGDAGWHRRAKAVLTSRAAAGDGDAMRDLGTKYRFGTGVPENLHTARDWYRRATEAGDGLSALWLGKLLLEGRGGPVDDEGAFRCFVKASELGQAEALYWMAKLCDLGRGVERSSAHAIVYLFRALELNEYLAKATFLACFSVPAFPATFFGGQLTGSKRLDWSADIPRLAQDELRKRGYYAGPIDGSFAAQAIDAVKYPCYETRDSMPNESCPPKAPEPFGVIATRYMPG